MIKNQSATVPFFMYVPTSGAGATGATNISVFVSKDGGTPVAATNTPTEVSAANCPGIYKIVLTASEMNAEVIVLSFAHASYAAMPVTITPETINVSGALETYGAAKPADVASALTNYGAAKPGAAMTLTNAYDAAKSAASAEAVATAVTAQTSVLTSILQEILAGLFNWGLSHDVLTIYKDGVATKTFRISRDSSGNITTVEPIVAQESEGAGT